MNVFTNKKIFCSLRLCVSAVTLFVLTSCGVMVKLGIKSPPDLEQRRGPSGSPSSPAILNPFERVELVMTSDECRVFRVRVPGGWYVKYLITAVNRRDGKQAYLKAGFKVNDPSWAEMAPNPSRKEFFIREGSSQAVVAIANQGKDRDVLFELCQEGPPVEVILQPEASKVVDTFILPKPAFGKDEEDEKKVP